MSSALFQNNVTYKLFPYKCVYILFNPVNLEFGTIPSRTNEIFKNRIMNLSNPSEELNVNKIRRANNFLF